MTWNRLLDPRCGTDQSCSSAGNDAFLDSGLRGVKSIIDSITTFLQLRFSCPTDTKDSDAASQPGDTTSKRFSIILIDGRII
jgi:hypothetical protein